MTSDLLAVNQYQERHVGGVIVQKSSLYWIIRPIIGASIAKMLTANIMSRSALCDMNVGLTIHCAQIVGGASDLKHLNRKFAVQLFVCARIFSNYIF